MKPMKLKNLFSSSILACAFALTCFTSGTATAGEEAEVNKQAEPRHRILGVMLDVGVPDIAAVSVVGRPWRWLRLHLGLTNDVASFGIRGGATYVPFNFFISPSATIEGGHFFEGDMNKVASMFAPDTQVKSLERFSYSYFNGHIGFELGAPNRFLFYIHAGMSYVATQLYDVDDDVNNNGGESAGVSNINPSLGVWFPSAKLGFVLYII